MISFAFFQLETKTGKAAAATLSAGDPLEPADLKVALKREREEHQHLLAESYAAVMDLTKQVACSGNETLSLRHGQPRCRIDVDLSPQLQIGERNWGREKLELLERFSQERAQWEQRLRDATTQQGMVGPERVHVCVIRRREVKIQRPNSIASSISRLILSTVRLMAVDVSKVCCCRVSPLGGTRGARNCTWKEKKTKHFDDCFYTR